MSSQKQAIAGIAASTTPGPGLRRQGAVASRRGAVPAPTGLDVPTPEAMMRALHDHQVELEMQNEELRRVHLELDAARARYYDLYEKAPVGYLTICELGLIVEANISAATLLGATRAALVSQPFSRFILQADHEVYHLSLKRLVATAAPHACELRLVKMDATVFWVRLEGAVSRDAQGEHTFRCVLSDITAEKKFEAAMLVKSRVFDASITANSIANIDGIITEANAEFLRLWGYAHKDEAVGKSIAHYLNKQNEVAAIMTSLNGMGHWEGEFTALRKDGSTFIAHGLATVVLDQKGENIGYQSAVLDVTERSRTQTALRESEAKYRALFSMANDGIILLSANGDLLAVNEAFARMHGYSVDAMLSMNLRELDSSESSQLAPERLRSVLAGEPLSFEVEHVHRDGHVFPLEVSACLHVFDGVPVMQAITHDITESRRAEQALRELNASLEQRVHTRTLKLNQSEGRFRLLAEASFEGIAICENGILLDANPQCAADLGYALAEMMGRPMMDFIAPESRALIAEHIGTREGMNIEGDGVRKDGSTFPLAIRTRMGTWQGKITQIVVLRDLSDAKLAAATLHVQQTELEHVQRLALVSEVSAGIIHQLCQPLSAIGANIAAIMARLKSCGARLCGSLPIVRDIEADVARMREIVTHLRDLAKPGPAVREGIDLNAFVMDALPLLQQKAGNCHCRLASELGRHLPPVYVDAVQMRQVIYNMVSNAFEACAACPKERRVVVLSTRVLDGDGVEVCVRDAGVGIAPETESRLFKTFFTTKPDGLGVGLRLSRTIVEAHGGSIYGCNNTEGNGATFRVVLPAHQAHVNDPTANERMMP